VQLALQRTLALVLELKGQAYVNDALSKGLDISIVGDNDFYSQRATVCISPIAPLCIV
jgi:phosphomevalonate kinase